MHKTSYLKTIGDNYFSMSVGGRILGTVRVVSDPGCERIHKEKEVQRVEVLVYFPREGKAWYGDVHQHLH